MPEAGAAGELEPTVFARLGPRAARFDRRRLGLIGKRAQSVLPDRMRLARVVQVGRDDRGSRGAGRDSRREHGEQRRGLVADLLAVLGQGLPGARRLRRERERGFGGRPFGRSRRESAVPGCRRQAPAPPGRIPSPGRIRRQRRSPAAVPSAAAARPGPRRAAATGPPAGRIATPDAARRVAQRHQSARGSGTRRAGSAPRDPARRPPPVSRSPTRVPRRDRHRPAGTGRHRRQPWCRRAPRTPACRSPRPAANRTGPRGRPGPHW